MQADVLKVYHNVKPDVLYRADDLWDITKYNSIKSTKSTGTYMKPYYTMVKTSNGEQLGLVQIYTPYEKQNITDKEIKKALDSADLFLRNRANSKPAPLNEYDIDELLNIANVCNDAYDYINRLEVENEKLKNLEN